MRNKKLLLNNNILAFALIALILIIFSFPYIPNKLDEYIVIPVGSLECINEIVKPEKIFPLGMLTIFILFPVSILYSRFIYKRYGVFITQFQGKYSPEIHYKEFIKTNFINKLFGILTLIIWGIAGCYMLFVLASAVYCWFLVN